MEFLSAGLVIIFLLLGSYLGDWYFQSKLDEESDTIVNINTSSLQLEQLKKENDAIVANLSLLSKLKGNRSKYSNHLYDISRNLNNKTTLTALNIKEESPSSINIDITGLALWSAGCLEVYLNL